jgi:phospholipid/cholesterol/gamma-HCH transport system substrate-binding protein
MAYTSSEVKSGIFITCSIALLLGLTFMVGKFALAESNTYRIRFGYISGLENNAPVYVAGHKVGKVDEINIVSDSEKSILVSIQMPRNLSLHEDAEAFIDTLGMMGEKFIELAPGSLKSPLLKPGATIEGTAPIPMYRLIQKMNLLADRSDELTVSLNALSGNLNKLISGRDKEVGTIMTNFQEMSENLKEMSREVKFHPWRLIRKS